LVDALAANPSAATTDAIAWLKKGSNPAGELLLSTLRDGQISDELRLNVALTLYKVDPTRYKLDLINAVKPLVELAPTTALDSAMSAIRSTLTYSAEEVSTEDLQAVLLIRTDS
jgi:hypothetical protein